MKRENNHGYVMGWIIIVMMVLMVLVLAALSAAGMYHKSSRKDQWKSQAYDTARSMAVIIAEEFTAQSQNPTQKPGDLVREITARLEQNGSPVLVTISGLGEQMGECSFSVDYNQLERILTITVYVVLNEQHAGITVVLEGDQLQEEEEAEPDSEAEITDRTMPQTDVERADLFPSQWKLLYYKEADPT